MSFRTNIHLLPAAVMLVATVGLGQLSAGTASSEALRDTTWDSRGCFNDARGQWFRDAKFGAFIHFGPYSHLGGYWQGQGPYRPAEQIIGLGGEAGGAPPSLKA